jgi:phosphoribosylformimino-5-aminoimidazole carboxamide ribotide isomerase
MRIIPAIDISEGQCVRLTQGDYGKKTVYSQNPMEVAADFEQSGLEYLHVVDLDGAKQRRIVNLKALEQITGGTELKVDFGGGIQTKEDLEAAFRAGVRQVTIGSIAVKSPQTALDWLGVFGPERLILGADARDGKIASSGWTESSSQEIGEFVSAFLKAGFRYVVCTDIGRDGMLSGPAVDLYRDLIKQNPEIKLVASGGIRGLDDLDVLAEAGLDGAIVGKAIYEGHVSTAELSAWVSKNRRPC